MEAGLDNSNNPFGMPNGANTDNIISQKSDGLLLNLTDNFKQNGTDLPTSDFFSNEKSNGKRLASDFDDEDFGPETDVDALDDALSPVPKESITKNFADAFSSSPNNNLLADEGVFNPFMEHQEKAALEMEKNMRKRESREEFEEEERLAREETPTPPADAVHDVSGLVENPGDSESEDEWNYFKGDEANKENISPQPEKEVVDIPEEDDTMSNLNPNAAEFVPVSPTRSVPSPTCRMLINDQIVSQSPKKVNDVDLNVPDPKEFENEVKSRPSEIDTNGHSDSDTSKDLMENVLNGKNIDEIPEFQPGSTPKKNFPSDEFHFGPNAAPFTPKLLDQSEALSTKAVYGDESVATLETSFNESGIQDLNILNKESDPMSMSFYADKGDSNPFDLNKVQMLPDDIDEFLNKPDNEAFNETISDLPEHHPLGEQNKRDILNNDDAIQITDLDKQSYDDEKELASPLEPEKELLTADDTDFSKTPEPTHENLLQDFCCLPKTEEITLIPTDVELISPVPSPLQEATEVSDLLGKEVTEASDFLGKEATEVNDLLKSELTEVSESLKSGPESMPPDVEVLPEEVYSLNKPSKHKDLRSDYSPEPTRQSPQPKLEEFARIENQNVESAISPHSEASDHPLSSEPQKDKYADFELISQNLSPIPQERLPPVAKSPIVERSDLDFLPPVCDKSNLDFLPSTSPFPSEVHKEVISPADGISEKINLAVTPEPTPEHFKLEYPVECGLTESKSPIPEAPLSPSYTGVDLLEKADERFEELCKPLESPQEDITSSVKDDLSFDDQVIDSFVRHEVADVHAVQESEVSEKELVPPSEVNAVSDQVPHTESAAAPLIPSDGEPPLLLYEPKERICIYPMPLPPGDREAEIIPFDVKTETISPEFAQPTIVTPSEESKADDLIITDEPIKEPPTEEQKAAEELQKEMTAVGVASAVATGAAITAVVASTKVDEKKKSPSVTSVKKTSATRLTANKSPAPISKTSPKLSTSATKQTTSKTTTSVKATTPKTGSGITKPPAPAPAPKASPRSNLTRPRAAVPPISRTQPTKPAEKSPMANGEIKNTARSTLAIRKTVSETNGTKAPTSRLATTASKLTQSKVTAKPATATAPSKTTIPPRVPLSARVTSSATAKRPTSLTSKPTSGNTSPDKTSSTVKTTLSKTSPKSTTNVPPKPKSATNTLLSKPRVPLTRTVAKAPADTEKQIKESANKITASRTVASAKSIGSSTTTSRAAFSSTKRVESKVSSTRTTVTKTSTTTSKSTTAKKPTELVVRGPITRTKTTKIEKPKENGMSTVVTEEITVVNNTNTVIDSQQPELVKDNSPVDNKLLIETTTQLVETNAD